MLLSNLSQMSRSEGDPRVLHTGPSSLTGADRLARVLGWVSYGLGIAELVAPNTLARALGLDDRAGLLRLYGAREIAGGMATLSVDKSVGLAARLAGDALDLATLSVALGRDNPKRDNAMLATAVVGLITLLDIAAYTAVKSTHSRSRGRRGDYSGRSGLPRGAAASRGLARKDFRTPPDYQAEGTVAASLPGPSSA